MARTRIVHSRRKNQVLLQKHSLCMLLLPEELNCRSLPCQNGVNDRSECTTQKVSWPFNSLSRGSAIRGFENGPFANKIGEPVRGEECAKTGKKIPQKLAGTCALL
eukprot:1646742-Rhodomonas_salina.2